MVCQVFFRTVYWLWTISPWHVSTNYMFMQHVLLIIGNAHRWQRCFNISAFGPEEYSYITNCRNRECQAITWHCEAHVGQPVIACSAIRPQTWCWFYGVRMDRHRVMLGPTTRNQSTLHGQDKSDLLHPKKTYVNYNMVSLQSLFPRT